MIAFCPAGPTSRKSRSSGNVWSIALNVTVTLTIVTWAETTMFEGYGLAIPLSGMNIGNGLMKKPGVHVGVGVGVGVLQGVSVYCWLSLVPVPGAELPATA